MSGYKKQIVILFLFSFEKEQLMIKIENGRIFVDGKETVDPTLIGYAVLDAVEEGTFSINTEQEIDETVKNLYDVGFEAGKAVESTRLKLIGK
jgi:hypothetical protein